MAALPLLVRLVPVYIDDTTIKYNIVANVAMEDVELLRIPLLFQEALSDVVGYGSITNIVQQTTQSIAEEGHQPSYEHRFWQNASFNPKVSGIIANGGGDEIDGSEITQNIVLLTDSVGFEFAEGDIISTIWVSRPSLYFSGVYGPNDVDVTFHINGAIQFAGTVKEDPGSYTGVLGSSDVPAFVLTNKIVDVPSAWISVVVKDALSSATSPSFLKMVGAESSTAGHIEIINIKNPVADATATLGYEVEGYGSAFVYHRTVLDEDIDDTDDLPEIDGSVYALYLDMNDQKVVDATFDSGDILALSRIAVGLNYYADGSTIRSFSPLQILAADYNRNGQIDGGDLLGLLKQKDNAASELRWLVFDEDDVIPSDYLSEYDLESDQDLASDLDNQNLELHSELHSEEFLTRDLQQLVLQTREDLIVKGMPEQGPNVISVLLRGNVVGPIIYPEYLTAQNYSESRTYSLYATDTGVRFNATLHSFGVGDKIVFEPSVGSEANLFDAIVDVEIYPAFEGYSWDQGVYSAHLNNAFTSIPADVDDTRLNVYTVVYPDFGTVLFLDKCDSTDGDLFYRIDAIIELPGYFIDKDHGLTISTNDNDGASVGLEVVEIVLLGIVPPG